MVRDDEKYGITMVVATDWCYYEADRPVTKPDKLFTLIDGYIVGLNIFEDEKRLVLAHQYFPEEEKVRHTTVINKDTVIERVDFELKDGVVKTQEHEIEIEDED
jgi:hypothetical protein